MAVSDSVGAHYRRRCPFEQRLSLLPAKPRAGIALTKLGRRSISRYGPEYPAEREQGELVAIEKVVDALGDVVELMRGGGSFRSEPLGMVRRLLGPI